MLRVYAEGFFINLIEGFRTRLFFIKSVSKLDLQISFVTDVQFVIIISPVLENLRKLIHIHVGDFTRKFHANPKSLLEEVDLFKVSNQVMSFLLLL
jgi:hypothetical protein